MGSFGEGKGAGILLVEIEIEGGVGNALAGGDGGGARLNIGSVDGESGREENGADIGMILSRRRSRKTERWGAAGVGVGGGETKIGGIFGKISVVKGKVTFIISVG